MTVLLAITAAAGEWFDGTRLDYWDEGEPAASVTSIRAADAEPFDWSAYEDPSNPLFWDDGGDWVPPRPLREVLADPTPDNVARYRAWVARKLELARMGQELLWGRPTPRDLSGPAPEPVDWRGVRVAYFYQASCPHCQRSEPVVEALRVAGASVVPVHLDEPVYADSVAYTAEMHQAMPVLGTPTWVVQVGERRAKIAGFATFEQLGNQVRRLRGGEQ